MPCDELLAGRIRRALAPRSDIAEKRMFGGVAFLLDGKMFCGVVKEEMMVRVGPDRYDESLRRAHVRPMDFTGRQMRGYVFVESPGCKTLASVRTWAQLGISFVERLTHEAGRRRREY